MRLLLALASALALVAAQGPAADDPAKDAAAAAADAEADLKQAEDTLSPGQMEKMIETDLESTLRHTVQELHGLNVTVVMQKAAPWQNASELEAFAEKAFAKQRGLSQSELDHFVQDLEALPRNATANSTMKAKSLLASMRKAEKELESLDKSQAKAMHHALRRAEHSAKAHVRSLQKKAFHSARQLRKAGSKIETTARKMKVVPEEVYERAHDKLDDTSEDLSSKAEELAERLEDKLEDRYSDLADQVQEQAEAMRHRGRERREAIRAKYSELAKTRVAKGARTMSFLEAAASNTQAQGMAMFMAGVMASMAGTFAVVRRSRISGSEAPLLG